MSNMLVIIKKELARFFGDKRLVFTTAIMPGLLIFLMYTIMGEGLMKEFTTEEDYVAKAYVRNMPAELESALKELPVEWEIWDGGNPAPDQVLQEITDGVRDGLMAFPDHFMQDMRAYEVGQGEAPNVEIYYNSEKSNSGAFRSTAVRFLDQLEESVANKFDVNRGEGSLGDYDRVSEQSVMGQMLAGLLPMLIMTFIFSGCTAVAPESIAGEKERGTIATLLVTPMKRSALALGKIVSLSVIALLAGLSSFLGTILSLPKLMTDDVDFGAASYTALDYVLLFAVILSTVLVTVAVISLISAGAKSVKEASTAIAPFLSVIIIVSLLPLFHLGGEGIAADLIPLYNSVMTMNGIFGFEASVSDVVITVLVNFAAAGILGGILTKMFSCEKVMFNR